MNTTPILLLVDDDEDVLALGHCVCRGLPCILHTASSGEQALALAKSLGHLDVIVSDLNMGEMDGVSLLRRLRAMFPQSERILCSGNLNIDLVSGLMEEGLITRAIQKPMPLDNARRMMDALIRHTTKRRDNVPNSRESP